MKNLVVILAGGKGSRMKSELPKALVELNKKPLIGYVIDNVTPVISDICIVYSKYSKDLKKVYPMYKYAYQKEALGAGDALRSAMNIIKDYENVMVLSCDMPLISTLSYQKLYNKYQDNTCVYMTTKLVNPTNYGRIVKDGSIIKVVEEADVDETNRYIQEVNVASYMFKVEKLIKYLPLLNTNNKKGEYLITDLIYYFSSHQEKCDTCLIPDQNEFIGVNSPIELHEASEILRKND